MRKKIFCLILSIVMIFALCSCAAANTGNSESKTDTNTTIDETVNNKSSTEIVDENGNEIDTNFIIDKIAEDNVIVFDITEQYDISVEEAESLYNTIAKQIVNEYLVNYDIKPEDFAWPSTNFNDDESVVWSYLQEMVSIKLIYLQSNLDKEPDIIKDYATLEQKSIDLMNCTYKAIISWYDENGNILPDYMMWQDYLPGNITVDRLCEINDSK